MNVDPTNGKPLPTQAEVINSLQQLARQSKKNGVERTSPLNREQPDTVEQLYIESPSIGLVEFRKRMEQYAQQVAIEELKGLREATKQITHVDAHISDASVAQGIRVHTNALLERRIAELDKERKQ